MIKILASDFKNYEKINGEKIARPMDNSNGIVDQLKINLTETKKVVFVASNINDSSEHVLSYANIFFDSMKMVGINFEEYCILDGENKDNIAQYINGADLIFLCGGSTYSQHVFFETINLKTFLEKYDGIIVGQSAGALNMAESVFNSPEKQENSEPIFFDGLGLTDINIEPHFMFDDSLFGEDEKFQRNVIIQESYKRPIYGQCNGSHIFIDNQNNATICGETYLIYDGNVECVCKNGQSLLINPINSNKKI